MSVVSRMIFILVLFATLGGGYVSVFGLSSAAPSAPVKPPATSTAAYASGSSSSAPSATASADPSVWTRLRRRTRVFLLAGRVYLSYKNVERRERGLRRRLGLPPRSDSDDSPDHPLLSPLREEAHVRNAARLRDGIGSLRGFWIKVGQYLSTRADVMPGAYVDALSSLQDDVPAVPFGDVRRTLREEFEGREDDIFSRIDPAPLSTASLAQVHRAVLRRPEADGGEEAFDGREVVVKVQHRGVASLMRQDMSSLRIILSLLARSDPDLDFGPVCDEYSREVERELDFRTEAANMFEVRRLLRKRGNAAVVPRSAAGLVTERVLTMEYCAGFSVRDVAAMEKAGTDRGLLLRRICEAWAAQMHVGGLFNADPHAGNILVSTAVDGDASVPVLLDFGLTKRLDDRMRVAFARLVHAADESDVDALLRSFEEMGLVLNRYDPLEDMAAMRRSLANPVPQSLARQAVRDRARERKMRESAMLEEQEKNTPSVEGQRRKLRNPVDAWPAELIFFTRVTAMLRGLCSRLEVPYPYLRTMAATARTALIDAVPPHERASDTVRPMPSLSPPPSELVTRLRAVAADLVAREEAVGFQVAVVHRGETIADVAAGSLGTADPRPILPSTLFNAFSASKAVLAGGALLLLEEEAVSLDDRIREHWPAFASPSSEKGNVTVRHALAHQAGLADALPDGASLDSLADWDAMVKFVASDDARPAHPPGEQTRYHYLSFAWIVGGLLEAKAGRPYEEFLEKILGPAHVENEAFMGGVPADVPSDRLAVLTMYRSEGEDETAARGNGSHGGARTGPPRRLEKFRGREQMLNPSVFNMRKVRGAKLPSANGHFSARALAKILDVLAVEAEGRPPLLSAESLEAARTPQAARGRAEEEDHDAGMLDDDAAPFGLGFQLHDFVQANGTVVRSIGHAGLGGSVVVCLPELGLSVTFLTNQLSVSRNVARERLLQTIFDYYELQVPKTFM
uniref:Beta-lactamase-related domain-containing protein n=1 Tax=Corethron hystrix TaxID=216773 RepID=A0A7S1B696_9STRA|mmetsp:Transcript_14289/g.31290  ORF Transcript_14289/g.31290 Transcript_14289/m.31290 type:complete len:970 (+) Transcript_14289:125-3034(+)